MVLIEYTADATQTLRQEADGTRKIAKGSQAWVDERSAANLVKSGAAKLVTGDVQREGAKEAVEAEKATAKAEAKKGGE